jgi:hypothetical protein
MAKVKVTNATGLPKDTKISIDGVELEKSALADVDIRIRPDEFITATIELHVDELDVVAELLK